jgi:nucleotide-binding universal stress UspA family protein
MMERAVGLSLENDIESAANERASEIHDRAREIAAEHDRTVETIADVGRPGRAIVEHAKEYDTVILGSHSSGLVERLFVGNVAETVFQRSPVAVTVIRE